GLLRFITSGTEPPSRGARSQVGAIGWQRPPRGHPMSSSSTKDPTGQQRRHKSTRGLGVSSEIRPASCERLESRRRRHRSARRGSRPYRGTSAGTWAGRRSSGRSSGGGFPLAGLVALHAYAIEVSAPATNIMGVPGVIFGGVSGFGLISENIGGTLEII